MGLKLTIPRLSCTFHQLNQSGALLKSNFALKKLNLIKRLTYLSVLGVLSCCPGPETEHDFKPFPVSQRSRTAEVLFGKSMKWLIT